jgi:hypothetical protein
VKSADDILAGVKRFCLRTPGANAAGKPGSGRLGTMRIPRIVGAGST